MTKLLGLSDGVSWLHILDPLLMDLHLLFIPFFVEQLAHCRLSSVHFILNYFQNQIV